MSTFILNPGDTIVMSDSLVVKVVKAVEAYQPVVNAVKEAETNSNDVYVIAVISAAVVVVALIAAFTVLRWRVAKFVAQKSERDDQARKDREDCERRMAAVRYERLLTFLEKKASKEEDYKPEESQYFINVMNSLINGQPIPTNLSKEENYEN